LSHALSSITTLQLTVTVDHTGCTALLLYVLGPSALVGIALVPVLIPVETWVANKSQAYRKTVLKVADAR
jgi:hypothetical protein